MSNISKQGVISSSGSPNPNLAINSVRNISPNASYNIANFNTSKELTAGVKFTVTIKGVIGENKQFGLWMGGGYSSCGFFTNNGNGIFTLTFTSPATVAGNGSRTAINIYAYPSSNSNLSSLEWLKLEEGSVPTLWIPNENDADFVSDNCGFIEINDNCKIQKNGYIQANEFIEI